MILKLKVFSPRMFRFACRQCHLLPLFLSFICQSINFSIRWQKFGMLHWMHISKRLVTTGYKYQLDKTYREPFDWAISSIVFLFPWFSIFWESIFHSTQPDWCVYTLWRRRRCNMHFFLLVNFILIHCILYSSKETLIDNQTTIQIPQLHEGTGLCTFIRYFKRFMNFWICWRHLFSTVLVHIHILRFAFRVILIWKDLFICVDSSRPQSRASWQTLQIQIVIFWY